MKPSLVLLDKMRYRVNRKCLQKDQTSHSIYFVFREDRASKNIYYHLAVCPLQKRCNCHPYDNCLYCLL